MKTVTKYKNKKVIVLGLARSGMSAAKLLHRLGAFVIVNDLTPLENNPEAQELIEEGLTVITGEHPVDIIDDSVDFLVKNPGIPYENIMVQAAQQYHIPVLTEVELAYDISEAPIIGITGTNGKTTTTMMLGDVINEAKAGKAVLAGNIGFPSSTVAQEVTSDQLLVLELSSFQLMGTKDFHPHIAAITNLFEAHLDYHHTRKAYIEAKWEIQKNMTADDFLILNVDQKETELLRSHTKATVIPFSLQPLSTGAYQKEGALYFNNEYIMSVEEIGVPGEHNIQNALVVIAIARLLDFPIEMIRKAIQRFRGAEHRLQFVEKIDGVRYYNDSKATNALATKSALSGFDRDKLVLLLGGLDRGLEGELVPEDIEGIKAVISFGETRKRMAELAREANIDYVIEVETLEQAVHKAAEQASEDDTVLLSPAHASWDAYKTFEARGEAFMNEVKNLKGC